MIGVQGVGGGKVRSFNSRGGGVFLRGSKEEYAHTYSCVCVCISVRMNIYRGKGGYSQHSNFCFNEIRTDVVSFHQLPRV